jgi:hypothetical protein
MERWGNAGVIIKPRKHLKSLLRLIAIGALLLFSMPAASVPVTDDVSWFSFEGRLFDNAVPANPLSGTVDIKAEILPPSPGTCVLRSEKFTGISISSTNPAEVGVFSVEIGNGSGTGGFTSLTMPQIFGNSSGVINGNSCTYTPATANDVRNLRISVSTDGGTTWDVLTPDYTILSAPSAQVAYSLEGLSASDFLQVGSGDLTQANLQGVFATGNAAKLNTLLATNPSNYVLKDPTNGTLQVPAAAAPASPQVGQIWYESGVLKYWNGSAQTLSSGGGSGTVTTVTAGTGLNVGAGPGGSFSTSGTLNVDVGTSDGDILQVQAGSKFPALDGSDITNLDASELATGTVSDGRLSGNIPLINGNNVFTGTNVFARSTATQVPLVLRSTDNSLVANAFELRASDNTVKASLPADGVANLGTDLTTKDYVAGVISGVSSPITGLTPGRVVLTNSPTTIGDSADLKFATGAGKLTVNGTNPGIGIGTTNPASMLDAYAAVPGGAPEIRVLNTDATGAARYNVSAAGAGNGALTIEAYGLTSTYGANTGAGDVRAPGAAGLYWSGQNGPLNIAATWGTSYLRFYTGGDAASDERMRITSTGLVGIGNTTPTALLHLKAGAAAANSAPLKFTTGTNLTTQEAGAVEFDGTNLYYTDSIPLRRTIATTAALSSYLPLSGGTMAANANLTFAAGTSAFDMSNATGTFQTSTGAVTLNGDTTLAAGKSLTLPLGAGTVSQTYNSPGGAAHTITANSLAAGKALSLVSTSTTFTGVMLDANLVGNNASNTGTVIRAKVLGALSVAVPIMATNNGSGASFRVNDDGTDTDTTPLIVDSAGNLGIGTNAPTAPLEVVGRAIVGGGGAESVFVTGGNSFSSGTANTFVGNSAGNSVTTGSANTALGRYALYTNVTGGQNTALGQGALYLATASGNTAVGYNSLLNVRGAGSNNIALGFQAGYFLETGSNNILIGNNVDAPAIGSSNYLNIGNAITGNLAAGNVGIGIGYTPVSRLDVDGAITVRPVGTGAGQTGQIVMRELAATGTSTFTIKAPDDLTASRSWVLPDNDGGVGQFLTSNGAGALSWGTPAGAGDDMGDHTAILNIQLGSNWLSGDGDPEGIFVNSAGDVGVGTSATGGNKLKVVHNGSTSAILGVNTGNSASVYGDSSGGTGIGVFALSGSGPSGYGVRGENSQTGSDGTAGFFINSNFSNFSPALIAEHSGTGSIFEARGPASRTALVVKDEGMEIYGKTNDNTTSSLLVQDSSWNTIFRIRNDGAIGIGTNFPSAPLDVYSGSWADLYPTSAIGMRLQQYPTNQNGDGNLLSGMYASTHKTINAGTQTGPFSGGKFDASGSGGAFMNNNIYGVEARSTYSGFNIATNVYGVYGLAQNASSGNITNAYGVYGLARTAAGPANITKAYSVYAGNPHALGVGTIGNAYGLFIEDVGGAPTDYAIYSQGGQNHFGGNVGIGSTGVPANLEVEGQIVSEQPIDVIGSAVDFNNGNSQVLTGVGASAITLNNMKHGGSYTLLITDTTVRTYTFNNCANAYYKPTNGNTSGVGDSIYSIMVFNRFGTTTCYISWSSGWN